MSKQPYPMKPLGSGQGGTLRKFNSLNSLPQKPPQNNAKTPMPNEPLSWKVRLGPIIVLELYLNFTLFMLAFGPHEYDIENPFLLYSYVLGAHVALFIGFLSGCNKQGKGFRFPVSARFLVWLAIIINAIIFLPNLYLTRTSVGLENIGSLVVEGLADPNKAYANKFTEFSQGQSVYFWATAPFYPLAAMMLPCCVVLWRKIGFMDKACFIGMELLNMVPWIIAGTTKGLADLFILLPFLIAAVSPKYFYRFNFKRNLFLFFVAFMCFVIIFIYFSHAKISRDIYLKDIKYDPASDIYGRYSFAAMTVLPMHYRHGAVMLTKYVVQGYYGLSLCLEEPFEWTYGFGHGFFSSELSRRILPPGYVLSKTYPSRVETSGQGWSATANWHTIYSWFASDVTFPGVFVVVFFIGRFFALSWRDVILQANPFAIAVFSLFILMIIYFPANNQILGFHKSAISFWGLFVAWVATRK
jgi:hypothetical protein